MINNVTLVGRITKAPELRNTQQNKSVTSFTLAVNRPFKNANGEREADFINCVLWGKPAENLANWTHKGQLIGITGAIQTRNYENQQGQRVYVTEIFANNFQILEKSNQANGERVAQPATKSQNNDSLGNSAMEISDDDLPF
jgi:single stranded DNA-binding protein (ssb)